MAKLDDILKVLEAIQKQGAVRQKREEASAQQKQPGLPDTITSKTEGLVNGIQNNFGKFSQLFKGNFSQLPKMILDAGKTFGKFASRAASAFSSEGASGAGGAAEVAGAGGAAELAEGVGGAVAATGPVGLVIAAAAAGVALSAALVALVPAVRNLGISFLESQRYLADFNLGIANTFQKFDLFQQDFTRRLADSVGNFDFMGTGQSGLDILEKSIEDLSNTILPYISSLITIGSIILAFVIDTFNEILLFVEKMMLQVLDGIDTITGWVHINTTLGKDTRLILKRLREQDNKSKLEDVLTDLARPDWERRVGPVERGGRAAGAGRVAGGAR